MMERFASAYNKDLEDKEALFDAATTLASLEAMAILRRGWNFVRSVSSSGGE